MLPGFKTLEQIEAKKDIERVVDAIQREIHYLDVFCHSWAAWDDTYGYILDYNMDFVVSNLNEETFYDQNLNLVLFVTTKGHVLWSHLVDLESKKEIRVKEVPLDYVPPDHPLLASKVHNNNVTTFYIKGILMTSRGPMLIASRPILNSANKGPARGTLVVGRFLNPSLIQIIQEQTRVDFQLWRISDKTYPREANQYVERLANNETAMVRERDGNILEIYACLKDFRGEPALLLRADILRNITIKGIATMKFYSYSIIGIGLAITLVLLVMIQTTVVSPISKLTDRIIAIGKCERNSMGPALKRKDEIGILAKEFNRLVLNLRDLSVRDELTGLQNRRGFISMVEHELKRANRKNIKKHLLYIDLDDFKQVNDTMGHREGDRALIEIAKMLKATFRETDVIARMGGDEFTVFFTNGSNIQSPVNHLKENLNRFNARQKKLHLSFSIGVAEYDPEHPCSIDALLSRADNVMYNQKRIKKRTKDNILPSISTDEGKTVLN
ncbi:MAG: diguanylate cyclase [Desulfobacterium sp.]|nr:diguanylate cyclase [Desulfobacterium sp.]